MNYFSCFFAALIVAVPFARADSSGKTALEVIEKHVADNPLARVVQVVGLRGQHQPKEWRVILSDPAKAGVFHTYTIQGGSVVKHEQMKQDYRDQLPGASIPCQEVQIDSGEVFAIADRAAKKAKIGFDVLNYELRCPELSRKPVWYVDLRDKRDMMVGRLFVSAKDGAVLRKVWFPQAAPASDDAEPQQASAEAKTVQATDSSGPLRKLRQGVAKISNPLRSGE